MCNKQVISETELDYDDKLCLRTVTDLYGRIVEVNSSMVQVSGYSRSELIGSCHNIVRHPEMPEVAFEDLWKTLQAGEIWRGIVKNRCKNGDYFWVDETITPVVKNGKVTGYHSVQIKPSPRQIGIADGLYKHLQH